MFFPCFSFLSSYCPYSSIRCLTSGAVYMCVREVCATNGVGFPQAHLTHQMTWVQVAFLQYMLGQSNNSEYIRLHSSWRVDVYKSFIPVHSVLL